jgi:hypothetical protein
MDRWFMRFLRILDTNIKVNFVPLDHFSSRPDRIAGFICHSSDQAEATLSPVTMLPQDNPFDLAKQHLGEIALFAFSTTIRRRGCHPVSRCRQFSTIASSQSPAMSRT